MAKQNKFVRAFKENGQLIKMAKDDSKEEILKFCDAMESVIKTGTESQKELTLAMLNRGNCPYTAVLKARGII